MSNTTELARIADSLECIAKELAVLNLRSNLSPEALEVAREYDQRQGGLNSIINRLNKFPTPDASFKLNVFGSTPL